MELELSWMELELSWMELELSWMELELPSMELEPCRCFTLRLSRIAPDLRRRRSLPNSRIELELSEPPRARMEPELCRGGTLGCHPGVTPSTIWWHPPLPAQPSFLPVCSQFAAAEKKKP
ncbi:hypothetical protein DUI87_33836 [Hirundo rustica rustica]|uniref:Uncharacterized protein n=1 Tax=Hirundo rustica rustica TaxID=333673 RepID=A0A3M0IKA1_HIRRU|nr:hypothetical protein DUI87_33836 [Hirundo rustica rustica]